MADPRERRSGVLLVTRNLPPLRGGMERLVHHIATALAERHALTVVGPTGCAEHLPSAVETREVAHRPLWRFLCGGALAVRALSRRGRHGLVVAGSGLAAPLAWWAARRAHARFAVYLHGLDVIAPSAIYQRVWLPFIRRADLVLVNSRNTRRLAIERGVPAQAIAILHPGTQLPVPDPDARRAFRAVHDLGERPLLLSVGRFTARKGLAEFVARALPDILAAHPDALLLVIGADADDAVHAAKTSQHARILRSAADAGVSDALRILPPCDDAALSAAYRAADVHVFPVLDHPGDVEGFGMVAIEAAAHGLPSVAFGVGGVPDAVIEGRSGSLTAAGDYAGFAAQVTRWLIRTDGDVVADACRTAAADFAWDRFDARLHALIDGRAGPGGD